jgi:hypothetical protein
MGTKWDALHHSTSSHTDGAAIQDKIADVRQAIFDCGMPLRCGFVDNIIGPTSLTAVRVSTIPLKGDIVEPDHQSIK